jgi:hypothetical protein
LERIGFGRGLKREPADSLPRDRQVVRRQVQIVPDTFFPFLPLCVILSGMARLPRFDLVGIPQHVVQRGNIAIPARDRGDAWPLRQRPPCAPSETQQ